MRGEVHRGDGLAARGEHGHGDRAEPVGELLVVHRDARGADALELGEQRRLRRERVRAAARERDAARGARPARRRGGTRGAPSPSTCSRRAAGADVEVEVDLVLVAAGRAQPLDVDDVHVVEDRHVDGVPRLVAEPSKVRRGDVPELHRVDRREAEVEDARAEDVLPRHRVLMEVPEPGERGDVPVRRAAREAELVRDLADADQSAVGRELRQDRKAALERLRRRGPLIVLRHHPVLHSRTVS